MASPPRKEYQQIPIIALSDWATVGMVKQALNELEMGMFRTPSLLIEAMGRDDRIMGVKDTRINSLNGLPIEWEPADDSQKALDVANACSDLFGKMFPEAISNEIRAWGIDIGHGISELLWEDYGADMWVPTNKSWNPQYSYWRWDTWTFWITTQNEGQVELLPGKDGQYKWFLYTPYGSVRGWVKSHVRSLAIPWLIRQWVWRDWARYSEIHGIPTRVGYVPEQAKEEHKQRFIRELSALGVESVIRCEQASGADGPKFDFKLIEAMSTNWEAFEKLLDQANTAIAVRMLGQNLTTEIGGSGAGSRAAAQVHDRVRGDFLRSDASTFGAAIKEQVFEPFCLFNFGSRDLAPMVSWKTDPPDDKNTRATMLLAAGQAMSALKLAGVPVDVIQLAKDLNVPMDSDKPLDPLPGAPGQPPSPGAPKPPDMPQPNVPKASSGQTVTAPTGDGKPGKKTKPTQQSSKERNVKPHIEGQVFADEVADHAVLEAKKILKADVDKVIDVVMKTKGYSDLRKELLEVFKGMDPSKFAQVMRLSLTLSDLNGRHSVREETGK